MAADGFLAKKRADIRSFAKSGDAKNCGNLRAARRILWVFHMLKNRKPLRRKAKIL